MKLFSLMVDPEHAGEYFWHKLLNHKNNKEVSRLLELDMCELILLEEKSFLSLMDLLKTMPQWSTCENAAANPLMLDEFVFRSDNMEIWKCEDSSGLIFIQQGEKATRSLKYLGKIETKDLVKIHPLMIWDLNYSFSTYNIEIEDIKNLVRVLP